VDLKKRLDKLEQQFVGEAIIVKLKGGGTATLRCKRILDIFCDVVDGRETEETRIVLAAESSNEDGRMIELMQAVALDPTAELLEDHWSAARGKHPPESAMSESEMPLLALELATDVNRITTLQENRNYADRSE
jgi:hypothetical protein